MSCEKVKEEVNQLVSELAKMLNLKTYTIDIDKNISRGDGYSGELIFVSLRSTNHFQLDVAIKKAFKSENKRRTTNVAKAYETELYFYSVLYPELKKFEDLRNIDDTFLSIPKFYSGTAHHLHEAIVMENLNLQSYKMFDKEKLLDEKHIHHIFSEYGKFHALSFAFKSYYPNEFQKLTCEMFDFHSYMANDFELFQTELRNTFKEIANCLQTYGDNELVKKFKPYAENPVAMFRSVCTYQGNYYGIVHGDCWSNNFLFKYDDFGNINSMRMIDFQSTKTGTPVVDLSYCLYAGASKEQFDRLDQYLQVYYKSFSTYARKLGCAPEKLYPMSAIKDDWKIYGKFGLIMGLLLTKVKLLTNGQDFNKSLFCERTRSILKHAVECQLI